MQLLNKHILLSFLFSLCFLSLRAQSSTIDSLENELKLHSNKDTVRINILDKLAFIYLFKDMDMTSTYNDEAEKLSNKLNYGRGKANVYYTKGIQENIKSNYKLSLKFFNQSLKHFKSIHDKKGVASVHVAYGITHFDLAQYQEAIDSYEKALKIYQEEENEREVITCLINIGNAYSEKGSYPESIESYKKALAKSEMIGDESGVSYVRGNLSNIYLAQGNYPLAIDCLKESLNYKKQNGDTLDMAIDLNNLGEIYTELGKLDKALEYHKHSLRLSVQKEDRILSVINNSDIGKIYILKKEYSKALRILKKALAASREIGVPKQISVCLTTIGDIYILLDKPLEARENYEESMNISIETGGQFVLANDYLGIGESYLIKKEYAKALSFVEKGKKIAKELELLDVQKKAEELLYKIYQKTNNYKKAFESHQQFKMLNDSLFNKENIEKITRIEYKYKYKQELESASNRELVLSETVKSTSLDLAKSQRNSFVAIIIILLVSIISASIIFFLKLRNVNAKTQNILIEQKLLRSQMTPHFIFNSLSVLQGMILNDEKKKAVSYLSKFSKLLRIILENSRGKTVSLNQELIAVENYLGLYNIEKSEAYNYSLLLDDSVNAEVLYIPPMLIQPFIENAIEHGFKNKKENRKIDIYLKLVNNNLICTIKDNGIGIGTRTESKNPNKKSLATTITSERLKIIGKDLKMEASMKIEDRSKFDEQGTIVTLVIPYKIDTAE